MEWLMENAWNVIIGAGLVLMVILILRSMIRKRKAGKPMCGCGSCGGCSGCDAHK